MYSKSDRRFIWYVVGAALVLIVVLRACEESMRYRGPSIDDGHDAASEIEESGTGR